MGNIRERNIKNPITVRYKSKKMVTRLDVPEREILPFLYENLILSKPIEYMSDEAISKWMENICILVSQISDSERLCKTARAGIAAAQSGSREKILTIIYDSVLAHEGLSTLRGFGVAKTESSGGSQKIKARFFINPEKVSIRTVK